MMSLQQTQKRIFGHRNITGSGVVLFGDRPDLKGWFEGWFPTAEAAKAFATKRGWEVADETAGQVDPRDITLADVELSR